MNVLIVGAGSVGQVYAHHLSKAGDTVTFYVRPKYRRPIESGLVLHHTTYFGTHTEDHQCRHAITTLKDVAAQSWDEVWLTVTSTSLQGEWLPALLRAADAMAVVTLQPGLRTRRRLARLIPESQIVTGAIGFLAWQAPLPSEDITNTGIRYWFPPLVRSQFSGPKDKVHSIVRRLRQSGYPAEKSRDAANWAAIPSAILMPHIAGLELENWSIEQFRKSTTLPISVQASREAIAVATAYFNIRKPFYVRLLTPITVRLSLWLLPRLAPFNIEGFLWQHFTKIGDQTRDLILEYIRESDYQCQKHDGLGTLNQRLAPRLREPQ